MEQIKRTFTREELHELVWSTPIVKLAEQYGLSDKGLAKTCERHLVPIPGRGYWAKLEAGQVVKRTPLRAVANTALHTVRIGSRPERFQSEYLTEVLADAKIEMEDEDQPLTSTPIAPIPPTRSQKVMTTSTSDALNPDVKQFVNELRAQKVDRDGFVYLKYVKVPPADLSRVAALINSIAFELAPYGFAFSTDGRVGFIKEGTKVDFTINAPRKRMKNTSQKSWYTFEYLHVGRFTMEIYGCAAGIGKNWVDTDTRKIEQLLPKIVESFRINFVAERERDKERRREEEHRVYMARRRELASLREKRETERLNFLRWIADARREVDDLRATVSVVPQSGDLPPEYERMIAWARERVAALENETAVDKIQATLVEQELYPDPDELFDPEGNPPPKANYWDD